MIEIKCRGSGFMRLEEIEDFQGNLKLRTKADIDKIVASIRRYGFSFPFFIWRAGGRNYCLDGHGRLEALAAMREGGEELPAFPIVEIEADGVEDAKQKLLRLNSQYGQMTFDSVMEFTSGMTVEWGDLELPGGDKLNMEPVESEEQEIHSLAERFLIPPFSVLDARQGWWQNRKRSWVALGIKSELGRGGVECNPGDRNSGCGSFGKNYKKGLRKS